MRLILCTYPKRRRRPRTRIAIRVHKIVTDIGTDARGCVVHVKFVVFIDVVAVWQRLTNPLIVVQT